ncbi:MAG TPA: DUF559 domain-containing protein [Actinomycetes bacterium]|nr:DUF559 domain-containing protein [Actinomycetes bacterium]
MRLLPSIYLHPDQLDDAGARERAALLYAGNDAVLSHTSALRHWQLPVPSARQAVHVTVSNVTGRRAFRDVLVIHTSDAPIVAVHRSGVPVTRLERSIVDSWALLTGAEQRAPAILAVSDRKTTAGRLLHVALARPNLKGRASLLALCGALEQGCRSELELWGLRHVFHDPRFADGVWQLPVRVGTRVLFLDLAFERERVDVELDGAAYHHHPRDRERDMRRDAALSTMGWLVLRYSYARLHADQANVTNEVAAVLATRRRQLHVA